jgi:ribosome assembly protein 1
MLAELVQPPGFSVHRADRNNHLSGKKKGRGVCFKINDSWCNCNNIQEVKSFCSPKIQFLRIECQPYYLPRELPSVIVIAVYIPPQADTTVALKEFHWTLCKLETIYPEAVFVVANLRTRLPKFYQHINCSTRAGKILDYCYSRDACKALPHPLSEI